MEVFNATFKEVIQRTQSVMSFRFVPEREIHYLPGQFVQLIFNEAETSDRALNKYLSFSCSPGKNFFEVTKKLTGSRFSQRISALKEGDNVRFKGPMGNCVIPDNEMDEKFCFIVGGIGITPIMAILEHMDQNDHLPDIKMLYSNWTIKDIAFRNELNGIISRRPPLKLLHVVVHDDPDGMNMRKGMINQDLIRDFVADYIERIFFILGPPPMVDSMKRLCLDMGLSDKNIKTESFIGYDN